MLLVWMSSANPKALCAKIKEAGMKAGVALKPGTPVDDAVFELVRVVLV